MEYPTCRVSQSWERLKSSRANREWTWNAIKENLTNLLSLSEVAENYSDTLKEAHRFREILISSCHEIRKICHGDLVEPFRSCYIHLHAANAVEFMNSARDESH